MTEIEIMGSKWMYLHELNRRIISILKTRACFRLSLTSVELNYFQVFMKSFCSNTEKTVIILFRK